jgi:hypothetical protein
VTASAVVAITIEPPCLPAGVPVGFAAATAVTGAVGSGPWVGSGSWAGGWAAGFAELSGVEAADAPACLPEGVGGGTWAQAATVVSSKQVSTRTTMTREP